MKKYWILVLLTITTLSSCGVSNTKITNLIQSNSTRKNNSIEYQVVNFIKPAWENPRVIVSVNEKELLEWFSKNPQYKYLGSKEIINTVIKKGVVKSFEFVKTVDFEAYQKKKEYDEKYTNCKNAIVDAHRGMPSPNLSRKNIEKAISLCKECCNDELEASFYKDLPYLKREVFLEYFPNSKYNAKIRQDIADLQSGKKKEVGMLEALGQAYNNSAVGQSIKEIGKNIPASNSEMDNSSNSANYEIIEQVNVKRFEFTTEQGQINASSLNLSVGCNDYSHQYNEETSKFSVQYISGDTNYRTNTDIASFNNEIDNKYFSQQDGAFVIIVFYNKDNEIVVLKLKFKNGGYYRLEVYPN
jgi:hypothetical protein